MSFSSDIKEELSRVSVHNSKCCQMAELTGYLITNCNIVKESDEFILRMSTENATVIRRVFNIFKSLFNIIPITDIEKEKNFKENLYHLKIIDKFDLEKIFSNSLINIDLNLQIVIDDKGTIHDNECCTKSFLRGVFMGSGSITNPANMYHLEVVANNMQNAGYISETINNIGISSKIIKRKKDFVVYIKGGEAISDFLAGIGANKGTISFEETRVVKDFRNGVNRLNNCENANYDKTIDAALNQIEDIMTIKKYRKFEKLSMELKKIANLRLEYREATLKELGDLIEPKLSRSGVNHRFRKLEQIAEELKNSN
jgi:DNA-binding protein WhiA